MKWTRWVGIGVGMLLLLGVFLQNAWATDSRNAAGATGAPAQYTVKLVLDGKEIGPVLSVSGIESEVEVVEVRSGTDATTRKLPGRTSYQAITISLDASSTKALAAWYKQVLSGKVERKSGSIIYLDREGNEVMRYNFFEAWPCRWKAPELNANSDTRLIEEIEFVVEKVERA